MGEFGRRRSFVQAARRLRAARPYPPAMQWALPTARRLRAGAAPANSPQAQLTPDRGAYALAGRKGAPRRPGSRWRANCKKRLLRMRALGWRGRLLCLPWPWAVSRVGSSGVAQWLAFWAHSPKVRGSKPRSANSFAVACVCEGLGAVRLTVAGGRSAGATVAGARARACPPGALGLNAPCARLRPDAPAHLPAAPCWWLNAAQRANWGKQGEARWQGPLAPLLCGARRRWPVACGSPGPEAAPAHFP